MIGEEAARDEPPQETTPSRSGHPWWRRRPAIAAGALTAAAVVCAAVVAGIGGAENGAPRSPTALRPSDSSEGGNGITYAQGIACSQTIVVGELLAVREAPERGRVIVTIDVQEWIKPASGPSQVNLNVIDPRTYNEERWKPGTYVLFRIPLRLDRLAGVSQGPDVKFDRKMLVRALPKSKQATCPPPFRPASN